MFFQIFLQVFLNNLVGSFYLSVALGVPGGRENFLYSELFVKSDKFRVIKLLPVICNYDV